MKGVSPKWETPTHLLRRSAPRQSCSLWTAITAEHERAALVRSQLEKLWSAYRPFATKHFHDQFPLHTQDRFWEMYLAVTLLQRGLGLLPLDDHAPDVGLINDDGQRVWLEAVAPGPGIFGAPDSVPQFEHKADDPPIARQVPEEQILLRLTHALREKRRQRARQLRARVIGLRDPYIIAVNVGGIQEAWWSAQIPTILKALFPIGHMTVSFDLDLRIASRVGWSTRFEVAKSKGASVPTTLFADPRSRGVSAVLYSAVHLGRLAHDAPIDYSADFVLVRNPFAAAPVPRGFLEGVDEWEAQPDHEGYIVVRPINAPSSKEFLQE